MTEPRKLYRKPSDAMVAGVCAGLAEYVGLDKTVVRVLFALITIFTFILGGLLVYVVLWVIMPPAPRPELLPGTALPPRI